MEIIILFHIAQRMFYKKNSFNIIIQLKFFCESEVLEFPH